MATDWRFGRIVAAAVATVAIVLTSSCGSGAGSASTTSNSAPPAVKEVSTRQLCDWMSAGRTFVLIDVREDNEWQAGHAAAALHIPRSTLMGRIATAVPDRRASVVLYCKGGVRSAACAADLEKIGYTNVFSLAGGFLKYREGGLPIRQ